VSVCITCKTADGAIVVGPDMFESVKAAIGESDRHVQVRPVQCLSVCKRPATVAVSSSDGTRSCSAICRPRVAPRPWCPLCSPNQKSDYGLVPWRERAEVLPQGHGGAGAADVLVTGRWKRAEMTALATTLVLGGARSGKSAFAEEDDRR